MYENEEGPYRQRAKLSYLSGHSEGRKAGFRLPYPNKNFLQEKE